MRVTSIEIIPETDQRRVRRVGLGENEGDRLDRLHAAVAVAPRLPSVRKIGIEIDDNPDAPGSNLRSTNRGNPRMVGELSQCASDGFPQFHDCFNRA